MYSRQLSIAHHEKIAQFLGQYGRRAPLQASMEIDFSVERQTYRLQLLLASKRRLYVIQALQLDPAGVNYTLYQDFVSLQPIAELFLSYILYAQAN